MTSTGRPSSTASASEQARCVARCQAPWTPSLSPRTVLTVPHPFRPPHQPPDPDSQRLQTAWVVVDQDRAAHQPPQTLNRSLACAISLGSCRPRSGDHQLPDPGTHRLQAASVVADRGWAAHQPRDKGTCRMMGCHFATQLEKGASRSGCTTLQAWR